MVSDDVRNIIAASLGVNIKEVVDEASLNEDLGTDSYDEVELQMAFEERFSIVLQDEDMEGVKTVGQVVELIEKMVV